MSTTAVVVGAAGYIGQAVSLALRRAGFKVYGVVRHEEKAKVLKQNEINIIIGDVTQPDTYKDILKQAHIVVEAITDLSGKLLEKLEEVSKGKSVKPLYIWTSGILSHKDCPHVVDETHENYQPLNADRVANENRVLLSSYVRGVVIRPGFVYGGNGGFFTDMAFNIKENDELVLYGRLDKRWSWVHVEDLADAFVRIAQAGNLVNGELFAVTGPWAPTYEELRVTCAKVTGWKGKIKHIPIVPKDNIFLNISEGNVVVSSRKIQDLLGWRENHLGIVADVETYFASWKAKGK